MGLVYSQACGLLWARVDVLRWKKQSWTENHEELTLLPKSV